MTGIDREALEAERAFLLRSLDDLEAERADGNVDDGTYAELHADYTARAAAVIRSLEAGKDLTSAERPPASGLTRALTVGGVVAFALVAAFLLTHAIGQRHPGQTITGNAQVKSGGTTTTLDPGPQLAAAVKQSPKSYAAHIAYARYLLQSKDFANAVIEFGAATRLDPKQPEPPTYAGWAAALLARQVPDPKTKATLLSAAVSRLDDVVQAHPKYPDAYAFRGVILFDFDHDARRAIPSFQEFLLLTDESNPLRPQVLAVLAEAEQAAKSTKP